MRRFASVCAVAVLVLVAASCGDDSDGDSAATTGGEAATTAAAGTTAAAPETTAAPEAEPTVVDVTMADFSYEAPDTIPAGLVTINGTNTSTAEEHQATIVRLNDGVTLEQALGTFAQDELEGFKLVSLHAGPNGVAPGASQSTTQELAEGNYFFVCFIPSPSDGVAHAEKGMLKEFTVTAPTGEAAAAPEADTQVVLDDYSFTFPADFSGQGTVEVVNEADQLHEMTLYQLAEGATSADVLTFLSPEAPPGPPPISPAGGSAAQAPGTTSFVPLELAPGNYVMICFVPDATSAQPHFTLGMIKDFTVT